MTKTVRFDPSRNQTFLIPNLSRRPFCKSSRRRPRRWTSIEGMAHQGHQVIFMIANHGAIKFRRVGMPAAFQLFMPKSYQPLDQDLVLRDVHGQDRTFSVTCRASRTLLTAYLPRRLDSTPPAPRPPVVPNYVFDIVSYDAPILKIRKVQVWPSI